jgi:hypothetical protein
MIVFSFISYIVSAILAFGVQDPKFEWLFLLPLIYGVMFHSSSFLRNNVTKHLSLFLILSSSFIRFVVTPFVYYLAGFYSDVNYYSVDLYRRAIFLMAYEEFVVFGVLCFFAPRFLYKPRSNCVPSFNIDKSTFGIEIIFIISIIILLLHPELLYNIHFVPNLTGEEEQYINDLSGGYGLLIDSAKTFLVLWGIEKCFKQYQRTNGVKYLYITLFLFIINSLFTYNLSRFGILLPALSLIYLIVSLYPKYRFRISTLCGIILISSVAFTSYIKLFSEARNRGEKDESSVIDWSATLQVYFQNVNDVVVGLAAKARILVSPLESFINDFISNIAVLSKFSDLSSRSLHYFHLQYHYFDKILPNICAGYYYLDYIGAPVIAVFFTLLALGLDSLCKKETDIFKKYYYLYAVSVSSLTNMIFYTMILSTLFNTIVFSLILLKLCRR